MIQCIFRIVNTNRQFFLNINNRGKCEKSPPKVTFIVKSDTMNIQYGPGE